MMGQPEPCVLYAHTFVHPQLDEYVDEVLFLEPVVITACEFLEQNASSICSTSKLVGATSPPSFALEIFIQCEGEARFRRLCLPLLYSQSSSNVLEIEAIVTNHLVVRGSYRSLSMVIYGNTAEGLGQFNIEVDIDSSLTNTVNTIDGNLEDLPSAFRPSVLKIEEFASPLQILSHAAVVLELPLELREILQLAFKILDSSDLEEPADKVISSLLSIITTWKGLSSSWRNHDSKQLVFDSLESGDDADMLAKYRKELWDVVSTFQNQSGNFSSESLLLESEVDPFASTELVKSFFHHFDFRSSTFGYSYLSQSKNIILALSMARLMCSARESCFHFVCFGGMEYLVQFFTRQIKNCASLQLLLLGVIDQATQHSVGCEGFLGWWPREDEIPPACVSNGYNKVLKLLLESQRHDVASFATQILQRIRLYEVACRYEHSVLSVLGDLPASNQVMNSTRDMLVTTKVHLQKLFRLLRSSGPIDDPSPLAAAKRDLIPGDGGQLSYKITSGMIDQSNCHFLDSDIDSCLLSILKERGFLPLSAALLSSLVLRSEEGRSMDLFLDAILQIEAIIIMLLFCHSGLVFMLHEPEVFAIIVYAFRGIKDVPQEYCFSVRYASVLVSKGFFCPPKEVGLIVEMHMRALCTVDRLCNSTPNTEEFLWVLWDLCRLSRSECGRQAMLLLVNFPEAINILMSALYCGRELDPASNNVVSPLNLAIVHATAEIFEVIVTDSTVTSLKSWIEHVNELHTALYSSSPGSNKKDAPARLLEWIDAGVVYHRNGVIGLLRYAAVLASGGDLHMTANSILASDMMDVDNVVGDSSASADGNIIDNLIGKHISEKDFAGVALRDSSIAQLTTALRILAFLSDNPVVAAALYVEGAVVVVHAIIISCKVMLERSSNICDFLVDEGVEGSSTSDFLLERNREKCLFDLLIPSLMLLINLLQELKDAKLQHRNTNIMNGLLQLHKEVSPKLVTYAADFSHSCPEIAFGIAAVCRLLASALACWPVYGWAPDLFQFLLDSLHADTLLTLGPKEACSLFCLLIDFLPDEGVWRWKGGMPTMCSLREMSVGTLLGPEKEKQINWHLVPENIEKLLSQLCPKLEDLGEITLRCAISMSVVLQDYLRIFVIRTACLNLEYASALVKPVLSWVSHRLLDTAKLSGADIYKVNKLLAFLAGLLEHPNAKPVFLREGGFQMLINGLETCIGVTNSVQKQYSVNSQFVLHNWSDLVFQSISLISDRRVPFQHHEIHGSSIIGTLTIEECSILLSHLLRLFLAFPVGKELIKCISTFKEIVSSSEGQSALLSMVKHKQSSPIPDSEFKTTYQSSATPFMDHPFEWNENSPVFFCWTALLKSIDAVDAPIVDIAYAVSTLASGVIGLCIDGESVSIERVTAIKLLFGLENGSAVEKFVKESLKNVEELMNMLRRETSKGNEDSLNTRHEPLKIMQAAKVLLHLLQNSSDNEVDAAVATECVSLVTPTFPSRICRLANRSTEQMESMSSDIFGDTFLWEFPENLRNRLTQTGLSTKRKTSIEGPNRLVRGDSGAMEISRGGLPVSTSPGLTRRDAFRQRKPNTSRPPSMHVDDYVARERNADGTNSSNVIAVPRTGSSSGRPPSIHVDVFMARQKERQSGLVLTGSDTGGGQVNSTVPDDNLGVEKSGESLPLRPDLDDDLQGIDIVFDAEECDEPDDDNLLLPGSVPVEPPQSPHSMVEEAEKVQLDESASSEYYSRTSASRMEIPLSRQSSISSDAKRTAGASGSVYMKSSSAQYRVDSRPLYSEASIQQTGSVLLPTGLQSYYEQKIPPVSSQNRELVVSHSSFVKSVADSQSQIPPNFIVGKVQSEYVSSMATGSAPFAASISSPDPYGRLALPSGFGSGRPPLPPVLSSYPSNSLPKTSTSISGPGMQDTVLPIVDGPVNLSTSRSGLTSQTPPPPLVFRPGSIPINLHGAGLVSSHLGDLPVVSQSVPAQPTIQALTQLQPLQPPLISRPPAAQLLRTTISGSSQAQLLQQPQASTAVYFQSQQGESSSQGDHSKRTLSQQQDLGMSLQEYFRSPEAIQYLLSDRDKLCQLLEQHPKLLEMLQERLGQL